MYLIGVLNTNQFCLLTKVPPSLGSISCALCYYGKLENSLSYIALSVYAEEPIIAKTSFLLVPYNSQATDRRLILISSRVNPEVIPDVKIKSILNKYFNTPLSSSHVHYIESIVKYKEHVRSLVS